MVENKLFHCLLLLLRVFNYFALKCIKLTYKINFCAGNSNIFTVLNTLPCIHPKGYHNVSIQTD